MISLNEYLKEEKKIILPDFEDIKESLLDDPEDQFNKYNDQYDVLKMLLESGAFPMINSVRKDYEEDPLKFMSELFNKEFIKVINKNGKNYKIDINHSIVLTAGYLGYLHITPAVSKLPIEIGKLTVKGAASISFKGLKDIPVNWIPEEIESTENYSRLVIAIENKRYSLDLSKRSTALSKLPGSCSIEITNLGGVTADKIIWNSNPVPHHLIIYTKFDKKTELSLPKIGGDLVIGKTGVKYYLEKLDMWKNQEMIKKVFGPNCEPGRLCE